MPYDPPSSEFWTETSELDQIDPLGQFDWVEPNNDVHRQSPFNPSLDARMRLEWGDDLGTEVADVFERQLLSDKFENDILRNYFNDLWEQIVEHQLRPSLPEHLVDIENWSTL
jgi:hypothetical protein